MKSFGWLLLVSTAITIARSLDFHPPIGADRWLRVSWSVLSTLSWTAFVVGVVKWMETWD